MTNPSSCRRVDLLVVSSACHTAVNRAVYRLFAMAGQSVFLVVPKSLRFHSKVVPAQPQGRDDPSIAFLELKGDNPRLWNFHGLVDVLRTHRPRTIVLDNDPASLIAIRVGRWAKRENAKLYCISCENMPLRARSMIKRRGLRAAPGALVKRALVWAARRYVDGVFTINNEGTAVFREEQFRNVRRIPLGFDPRLFAIDPESRCQTRTELELNGFVIGYFGRVTFEKGLHVLIAALSRLLDRPWTLVMDRFDTYASAYTAEVHDQLRAQGLLDRVVFVNPTHAEIGRYINAVDVIVMPSVCTPSWIEQYGRVAPEAMACGKLVVASAVGALPLLLGGHGVLFPEGDSGRLEAVLRELIDSKATIASEQIAAYARDELSIERQFAEMTAAFQTP